MTRRTLAKLLATGPALSHARAAPPSPLDRIVAAYPTRKTSSAARTYRADATVSFLGITIFSRANVGSARISVDQGSAPAEARTVALRFAAGSAPERTSGLNRLGFIQEFVVESKAEVIESAYFGFMTASPEKNLDQARAALGPAGKDAVPYTAVQGSAAKGVAAWQLYEMVLPSAWNFGNCDAVVTHVKGSLTREQIRPDRTESTSDVPSPRTFLYAVREAMRSERTRVQTAFLYNGKPYKLDAEKIPDQKMAQQLIRKKLIAADSTVLRLNGSIQDAKKGDKSPFRLWFENGADLPLRFEYRPRTYLNLAFEQTGA